jgi:alpha-beta hydrolase superfamily lysophospholipase
MAGKTLWEPPAAVSFADVVKVHDEVSALPDLPIEVGEDVFRVSELDMDWDIGLVSYRPQDANRIPRGPDGKRVGIFLLHGGVSDFKSVERIARLLPAKYGMQVATMTFPGRFYFLDAARDWPGDVENPDGSARTPLWSKETKITPDQYDIVRDVSKRENYGTLVSLAAKKGTEFYHRMAAWPAAFEAAVKEAARRQFPEDEFSVYIHGHSTGGPFAMMASQRVANIAGLLGWGSSPFGWMYPIVSGDDWKFPFNQLRLRTWRDTARYLFEGMKDKGIGLPMLIELTFERWESAKKRPNFKAEDFIHKNSTGALDAAARAAAARLKMSTRATDELIQRYLGYTRELAGTGVKAVPNFLSIHGIDDDTVTLKRGEKSLPLFAELNPAPKVRTVSLGAGVHSWGWTDEKLPQGIVPPVAKLWHDAIMNGFFERREV